MCICKHARLPCWVGGFRGMATQHACKYVCRQSPGAHAIHGKVLPNCFCPDQEVRTSRQTIKQEVFFSMVTCLQKSQKKFDQKTNANQLSSLCLGKFCSLPVTQILNYWIHTLLTPSYIEAMMKNACPNVCMYVGYHTNSTVSNIPNTNIHTHNTHSVSCQLSI